MNEFGPHIQSGTNVERLSCGVRAVGSSHNPTTLLPHHRQTSRFKGDPPHLAAHPCSAASASKSRERAACVSEIIIIKA
jgi:hypothetical protein